MIALPVFEHLDVDDFALYPGADASAGLHADFQPGLTMVLGANGLGKTTLVTMLFRMCSGPVDFERGGGSTLGGRNLDVVRLSRPARQIFASRVADGARNAVATLRMRLGDREFVVTRSLADLSLVLLTIDGHARAPGEDEFQQAIVDASGVPTFGDWLLVLRHVTFYFEERRALVWDPTAQRQVLRLLFLTRDRAVAWTERERTIRAKDSQVRNFQNIVGKEERRYAVAEAALPGAGEVRDELAILAKLQQVDEPALAELESRVAEVDSARQSARLDYLRAELDHDAAYRDLERRQLLAITSTFPSGDETNAYILAKLVADEDCLVCGHDAPSTAVAMRKRLAANECAICGSALELPADVAAFSPTSISAATERLVTAATVLDTARRERDAANAGFKSLISDLQKLRTAVTDRFSRIEVLRNMLPPEEAELHQQRGELASMRSRIEEDKLELEGLRSAFSETMGAYNQAMARESRKVEATFAHFAEGFLVETCRLKWHPHLDRVGESGIQIEFPAYELEMSGMGSQSLVRRSGPEQVSESQREFIDLAFRMTLMAVASAGGVGSLVIDAPESSLDAVFVTRAADVLTRFADPSTENRLITTSNVVEGNLIPDLIRRAKICSSQDDRIVDLFEIAAPTAATAQLKPEYDEVRRALFVRSQPKGK